MYFVNIINTLDVIMDLVVVLNHGYFCLQVKHYNLIREIYCKHSQIQLRKGIKKSKGIPRGSGLVKAPDLLDFGHYKGGRSSAKHTGRLYPRRNPWYSFSEPESTSGHMVFFGRNQGKNPN
jgi:hypothetical protein